MVYTITVHLHANDHPDSVDKLKAKLVEASRISSKDKETISWFVMQSTSDPRDFTIVERYENEGVSFYQLPYPPTQSSPSLSLFPSQLGA
jgi:quinol monooxygenase YgiN